MPSCVSRNGEYELRPFFGFTHVEGDPGAIARLQQSPVRYLQRPDKDYALFDPTRMSISGYTGGVNAERTGGRHWVGSIITNLESPGFEPNDIGRLRSADAITINTNLRYRETIPGDIFRNYSIGVFQSNEWDYGGNLIHRNTRVNINLTFVNFWTATLNTGPDVRGLDQRLTRGGPLMQTPAAWTTTATLGNRAAAGTVWNVRLSARTDEDGGRTFTGDGSLSFRSGRRWQLTVSPTYSREIASQQYVTTLSGNRPETYGQRYIFSFIDRSTLSAQFRLGYTVKPDLDLDLYAEPFAASGRYYDFGELSAPRSRQLRVYGQKERPSQCCRTVVESLQTGPIPLRCRITTLTYVHSAAPGASVGVVAR